MVVHAVTAAPLTAMTTWERHAAGLPARDKDEQARYAELDRCAARPGTGPAIEIISFGYGHGPAPEAHATFDVRHHFRDPHVDPILDPLTAEDIAVRMNVTRTPGVSWLTGAVADTIRAFQRGPAQGPVTIAIGCAGGRHRSAAIAIEVAEFLGASGVPVTVTHRDIHRPVIERVAVAP